MSKYTKKKISNRRKSTHAPNNIGRIAIGADHGGFTLKKVLVDHLKSRGIEVADLGTHTKDPCDYPLIGYKVAIAVSQGTFSRGILLCKSGVGIAIAANKVPGIRAAVCNDKFDAERSREHNDANVLVLGAEKLSNSKAKTLLDIWCNTSFEKGSRHDRRVKQISDVERKVFRSAQTKKRKV